MFANRSQHFKIEVNILKQKSSFKNKSQKFKSWADLRQLKNKTCKISIIFFEFKNL